MKAVKLLPALLVVAILAVAFVPVVDAADEPVAFADDQMIVFGEDEEEEEDPPTNEWYGLSFLFIFIIALIIAAYYGFYKRK